ncbi:uncharacterized protein LOC134098044 isoform X1 [Sardina pilchardus]|uniref:uncharacterized protein LOC134098044 isoform X1 n=1 Tax=Sardina pilchardus TaxID=27697 RepID=UPI002E0D66AF
MAFLHWNCEDVGKWIESLGYSHYTACFVENGITGRKLIHMNCRTLPKLGITDFEDMKAITRPLCAVCVAPCRPSQRTCGSCWACLSRCGAAAWRNTRGTTWACSWSARAGRASEPTHSPSPSSSRRGPANQHYNHQCAALLTNNSY